MRRGNRRRQTSDERRRQLQSVETIVQERADREQRIEAVLAPIMERFVGEVIDMGAQAIQAPVLLAAGRRRRDPFAFTNVIARWYKGIRELADSDLDVTDRDTIADRMERSGLPLDLYTDVRDVLEQGRQEQWTEYQTKRRLSAVLIPKESSGKWDTRAKYRTAVTRYARTVATGNFGRTVEEELRLYPGMRKEWVSRHDMNVRHSHAVADGQRVAVGGLFAVGGYAMRYPGDPLAPIGETANCRCVIVGTTEPENQKRALRASAGEGNMTRFKVTDGTITIADGKATVAEGTKLQGITLDFDTPTTGGSTAYAKDGTGPSQSTVDEVVADEEAAVEDENDTGEDDLRDLVMWSGIIGMEGTMTGDGRMLEPGSLRWDTPAPLRDVAEDVGAHDGAVVVGTIQHIERDEDTGQIRATGTFDVNSEAGREAARKVAEGLQTGVSMDLDDVSFEVRVAEEVAKAANLDGGPEASAPDAEHAGEARAVVDGRVVMMQMNSDDEVHVTTSGRIRAATLVAIPAFAEAQIGILDEAEADDMDPIKELDPENEAPTEGEVEEFNWVEDVGGLPKYIKRIAKHLIAKGMTESHAIAVAVNTVKRWARGGSAAKGGKNHVNAKTIAKAVAALAEWEAKKVRARVSSGAPQTLDLAPGDAVTASAAPDVPPSAWFRDPELGEPTAIQVTEDGRVFGHLATWDACHIAHPDFCTSPPSSAAGYAYFHTGTILTDGGETAVGHLTLNTTHAQEKANAAATLAHYENTGLAIADVRAGEDAHGIWVAGAVRPRAAEDDVRALRAAPLSGDWRRINGNLELVAALAVNVPGFPVPRPKGLVASGQMQSLVASGLVPPKKVKRPGTEGALSADDLRYLKALAARERRGRADRLARKLREDKVKQMADSLAANTSSTTSTTDTTSTEGN